MFKRGIENRLAEWADQINRKPLLLRGARQVGKTIAVRNFAERFDCFIELNLESSGDRAPFGRGLEVEDIFQAIVLRANARPVEGKTLLFLDEIQDCPEAVQVLRYFCEKMPHLHVIGAGSLLEMSLAKAEIEFPVGRVQHLVMYPLSFAEYLNAIGESDAAIMLDEVPLPPHAADHLLDLFHRYALVGGMPEVVAEYARTRDTPALRDIYESLLQSYLDDVPKYARNDTMARVLDHCIRTAPVEAGNRITFAGFGQSNYRSREVGEALRTLEKALLLHLLYPTTATQTRCALTCARLPTSSFLTRAYDGRFGRCLLNDGPSRPLPVTRIRSYNTPGSSSLLYHSASHPYWFVRHIPPRNHRRDVRQRVSACRTGSPGPCTRQYI